MLLATMPELSSHEKRVGRHHTHLARYLRSQQSSYLRFRLQFSGKVAVIAKVRLTPPPSPKMSQVNYRRGSSRFHALDGTYSSLLPHRLEGQAAADKNYFVLLLMMFSKLQALQRLCIGPQSIAGALIPVLGRNKISVSAHVSDLGEGSCLQTRNRPRPHAQDPCSEGRSTLLPWKSPNSQVSPTKH